MEQKPKRVLTEAQRLAFEKGREKRMANLEKKRQEKLEALAVSEEKENIPPPSQPKLVTPPPPSPKPVTPPPVSPPRFSFDYEKLADEVVNRLESRRKPTSPIVPTKRKYVRKPRPPPPPRHPPVPPAPPPRAPDCSPTPAAPSAATPTPWPAGSQDSDASAATASAAAPFAHSVGDRPCALQRPATTFTASNFRAKYQDAANKSAPNVGKISSAKDDLAPAFHRCAAA